MTGRRDALFAKAGVKTFNLRPGVVNVIVSPINWGRRHFKICGEAATVPVPTIVIAGSGCDPGPGPSVALLEDLVLVWHFWRISLPVIRV